MNGWVLPVKITN